MNQNHAGIAKNILKILLTIIGVLAGIYLLVKLGFLLAPFLIALLISFLMEPLIRLLGNKLKMKRKVASALSLFLVLSSFGLILVIVISKLLKEIRDISIYLKAVYKHPDTSKIINDLINRVNDIYLDLPPGVTKNIQNIISSFASSLTSLISNFLTSLVNTANAIPQVIIFTVVTILATYFLSSDRDLISGFITTQVPSTWISKVRSIKNDLFSALFGYIRAQLILMTITFTELIIGFSVIGIKYVLLFAFVISLIDALPILGTGTVLIPWAIFRFIVGDMRMALSLLVIYAIVLVVRQMIEPKVLGRQIGLHPLITLLAMYLGLKLFGFFGLILGPISVLLIKNILVGVLKNKPIKDLINDEWKI
jgi:sporulation integral membrane protein YtvI